VDEIFVDLIADHTDLVNAMKSHLQERLEKSFDPSSLKLLQINAYTAGSSELARWQAKRLSLSADHQHMVFLIALGKPSLQDSQAHQLWRETLNPWVIKGAVNLQVIRGSLTNNDCAQSLFQNATYALVSALCSASPKLAQMHSVQTEQALRPLAHSSRALNYVCEKCSDPECEHKLFGFLTQPSAPKPGH
jgi:hypothetical protein